MILELAAAIGTGEPVVLATVVRTSRSVPRRPGSKMLVFGDGRTIGSVGGGEMEHRVILEATEALADGLPRMLKYSLVDPENGDPGVCGGDAEIYLEPYMPKPTLYLIGAGHVGRAVASLADWLGFRIVVWDDRPDMLDEIEHAETKLGGTIAEALEHEPITPDTSVVMVTRNVALDLELLPPLLAGNARYIGLMGSTRRWQTTSAGLVEAGVAPEAIARVQTPIGIEIHAETPEEIAVSIMAAVIADQRGT